MFRCRNNITVADRETSPPSPSTVSPSCMSTMPVPCPSFLLPGKSLNRRDHNPESSTRRSFRQIVKGAIGWTIARSSNRCVHFCGHGIRGFSGRPRTRTTTVLSLVLTDLGDVLFRAPPLGKACPSLSSGRRREASGLCLSPTRSSLFRVAN